MWLHIPRPENWFDVHPSHSMTGFENKSKGGVTGVVNSCVNCAGVEIMLFVGKTSHGELSHQTRELKYMCTNVRMSPSRAVS